LAAVDPTVFNWTHSSVVDDDSPSLDLKYWEQAYREFGSDQINMAKYIPLSLHGDSESQMAEQMAGHWLKQQVVASPMGETAVVEGFTMKADISEDEAGDATHSVEWDLDPASQKTKFTYHGYVNANLDYHVGSSQLSLAVNWSW